MRPSQYRFTIRKPRPPVLYNVATEFPWGSHRNRTVGFVLEHNPSYIQWMIDNCSEIQFTAEVRSILAGKKKSGTYSDKTPWTFYSERGTYPVRTK